VLYQPDAEVLFPARVIASLRYLRGEPWQQLITHILRCPEDDPDLLAFSLVMIRLDGCLTCHADSYRAMRGCTLCAQQTIVRFKGTDEELVRLWETARAEVLHWYATGQPPLVE
jgi:hypothetical protein